ncbi:MAG: lysophospholipid acyltransferase family protein, partial [Limisphaerales bacterium]
LSDQHGGEKGLRLKFFGRDCSTGAAAAVLALRYDCPLFTSICYRTGLARWRIEVGDEILTHRDGQPRPTAEIMQDVNHAFEAAIRKDPANWFWVHNRWKTPGRAVKTSAETESSQSS